MRTSCLHATLWLLLIARFCVAQAPAKPAAPKAPPDVLTFTNGDRLTGKLTSASGGNVVFHSDMAGDLTVPFSKVKSLTSGSEFVALKAGKPGKAKAVASGTVVFEGGNITLTRSEATGQGTTQTLPSKELGFLIDVPSYAKEVDHRASFRTGWTGSATAGLTLVRSTESSTTFNGSLHFVRQIPTVAYLPLNHRTTIDVSETYGTNTSPVIPPTVPYSPPVVVQTSIFHADGERDQYFTPRLYALADTSFDHNFASGLQLQQVYGAGVGWTPLQNSKEQLDLKAEVHYERQQFIATESTPPPMNTKIIGSTFQENYRRNLPIKVVVTEWANILPAWNDFVAYSANAYFGVALPLYKRFNVSLSATDNYINNPAQYYRTNTVQYVTGVTYTFK
jgi:hypothetical protein